MELGWVIVLAVSVFAYALVSERLADRPVSGPMIFMAVGIAAAGTGAFDEITSLSTLEAVAEGTLVVLLFTDATRIDLGLLRRQSTLPVRLLGVGMPLTIALGALIALVVFPTWDLELALLAAAVLAPTDAALGRPVVTEERVPIRVRQALNVESGLNDGLALPAVTVFVALAAGRSGHETISWPGFVTAQIGFGVLVAVVVGAAGGWLLDRAATAGMAGGALRQLATLAVGVAAFAIAEVIGGNGFVAAFVSGLTFGAVTPEACDDAADFAEDEGVLLMLVSFLFFGAALVPGALARADWRIALYAVASLTVVRAVPVAIALAGTGLKPPTVAYLGWFGPRGLASIIFALVAAQELSGTVAERMLDAATVTVMLSVIAHGASAAPLAARYASWFSKWGRPEMKEARPVEPMRTR